MQLTVDRFGTYLKQMRLAAKLTQQQVADRTGVSNTYISALENNRKPAPPRAIVTALAACLETDESALWTLARSEREQRLRERVNGVPTSRRVEYADASESAGQPNSSAACVVDKIIDAANTPQQRQSLAKALEILAQALRDTP